MGPGESFGEEEVLLGDRRNSFVVCESAEGIIYSITKREFVKRISTEHAARDNVMEQLKIRIEWRKKRLAEVLEARQSIITSPPALKTYSEKKTIQGPGPQSQMKSPRNTTDRQPSTDKQSIPPETVVAVSTKEFFTKDKKKNERRLKYMQDFLAKMSGEAKNPAYKYKKSLSPLLLKSKLVKQNVKAIKLETGEDPSINNQEGLPRQLVSRLLDIFKDRNDSSKASLIEEEILARDSMEQQKMLPKFKKLQFLVRSSTNTLNSIENPLNYNNSPPSHINGGSSFSSNIYQISQGYNNNNNNKITFNGSGRLPLVMMKDQRSKTEANIEKTLSTLERSWRESDESLGFPKLDLAKLGSFSTKSNGNASLKLQNLFEIENSVMREPKNFPGVFKGKSFKKIQILSNSLSEEQIPEISRIILKQKRK